MEGAAASAAPPGNPRSRKRQLNVGLLQLEPLHGDVAASMARADALIAARLPDGALLDVLVLPEMAFTGYLFRDREQALPLAEPAQDGPTFLWARAVAMRLQCGVLVGFMRLAEGGRLYNSQMVVAPDGSLEACYDKHFL
jgi:protein N-terminal amidase